MDYLDWIKALDRAHQYAELKSTTLTSLHKTGAVFKACGYLSQDDISRAITTAASQHRDETAFGYCVYDKDRGWVKTDTMPQKLNEFFKNFEKPRIKCVCDKENG